MLGGMLPALLLIASRRKGEYVPATVLRVVGHPMVLGGVYARGLLDAVGVEAGA